jgi:NADH-quinone oxidoreductase subunit B
MALDFLDFPRRKAEPVPAPTVLSNAAGTVRATPDGLEVPEGIVLTDVNSVVNACRKYSLWPMPFATACCGIELMAVGAGRFDIARFGAEVMRFSPRQCDLLIVAGRVVMKILPVLQRIWLQMPEPKWCISMGACACTGGVFDTYAVVQGVDRFIPVDLYVPGCPPRPEQLIRSIIELQDKVRETGTVTGREFGRRTNPTGPPPLDPDEIQRIQDAALRGDPAVWNEMPAAAQSPLQGPLRNEVQP